MGILIRLVLFILMVVTAVLWYQSGAFLWWGLACVILFIVFLASLGMDGSDIVWYLD